MDPEQTIVRPRRGVVVLAAGTVAHAALVSGIAAAVAGLLAGCAAPPPPAAAEVQAVWRDRLPTAPDVVSWKGVPAYTAEMILQDLVEPRLMKASTTRLSVQAASDGTQVAFRLTWDDPTTDDRPGPGMFSDGCAIQVPRVIEPDVPDPQMGQPGRPVEITFWRASWQAAVAGRPDTIQALYPGAVVDHYPFEAPPLKAGSEAQHAFAARYAPADLLGTRREGPRDRAVEDLVAEGPGTLRPAGRRLADGRGSRTAKGWEVLIVRPFPQGLAPGGRSQIAFGVWEGSSGEAGSRKMRSGWVPLSIDPRGGAGGKHGATR